MWATFLPPSGNINNAGWAYAYAGYTTWRYAESWGGANSDMALFAHRSEAAAVPEPASVALIGLGVLGLALSRRKSASK